MKRFFRRANPLLWLFVLSTLFFAIVAIDEFPVEPVRENLFGEWKNDCGDVLFLFEDGKALGSGPTVSERAWNDRLFPDKPRPARYIDDDRGRWTLKTDKSGGELRIQWHKPLSRPLFLEVVSQFGGTSLRFSEDEMEKDLIRVR